MIENYISGNLYNERFSESSKEKCAAFLIMAWFLIVNKSSLKNYSTALSGFSSRSLSLYYLFAFSQRNGYSCNSSAKRSSSCICFPLF